MLGVTGTNGKTTTTYLLEAIARARRHHARRDRHHRRPHRRRADPRRADDAGGDRAPGAPGPDASTPAWGWPRSRCRPTPWSCTGSTAPASPPCASPTSPTTTSTSTPTLDEYFEAKARAVRPRPHRRRRGQPRRRPRRRDRPPGRGGRPRRPRLRARRRRGRGRPGRGPRRRADGNALPAGRPPLRRRPTSSSPLVGGSTSPTRWPRPPPPWPPASTSTSWPPGCRRRWSCPAAWSGSTAGQPFAVLVDYAHTPDGAGAGAPRRPAAGRHRGGRVDRRVRLRRRPRPRQAAADGPRSPPAWPTWSSSRPTTPAPRTRRRSSTRCWPGIPAGAEPVVELDRRAAIAAALADRRPGDVVDRGRQGPRAGPDRRRGHDPVRRPGRRPGGARPPRLGGAGGDGVRLTLADDRRATGGRDRWPASPHARRHLVRDRLPDAGPRGAASSRCAAERDGHDFVADALAAGARGRGRWCRPTAVVRPRRRGSCGSHDPAAALTALGAAARGRLDGVPGRRHHRLARARRRPRTSPPPRWRRRPGRARQPRCRSTTRSAAAHAARRRRPHRGLVVEMGARVAGNIAELCAIARPTDRRRHQHRPRPRRAPRRPRGRARVKGELLEALPADGIAVLDADDDVTPTPAPARTAARVLTAGAGAGRRRPASSGVAARRRAARRPFRARHAVGRRSTSALAGAGCAPGDQRAARGRRGRRRSASRSTRRRRARRCDRVAVADGARAARPTGVDRAQRRLQRQPDVDGRRAGRAGLAGAGSGPAPARLRRAPDRGPRRDARARRPRRRGAHRLGQLVAAPASTLLVAVARHGAGRRRPGGRRRGPSPPTGRSSALAALVPAAPRPATPCWSRPAAVGLERVAAGLAAWPESAERRRAHGVIALLLAAASALILSLVRDAAAHPRPAGRGHRPADPRRRPDRAPAREGGHPDDGRHRHRRRARCSATSSAHLRPEQHQVRRAPASCLMVLIVGLRRRRLRRRLPRHPRSGTSGCASGARSAGQLIVGDRLRGARHPLGRRLDAPLVHPGSRPRPRPLGLGSCGRSSSSSASPTP